MLLMHTHRPYGKCQYYIGRYEGERFIPERHGQLSWLGSMLAGPETLADDRGRRIFMGWIADARDWEATGWTGVVTLPWHLYPGPDNGLQVAPAEELAVLRYGEVRVDDMRLAAGEEVAVDALASDCMEARMTLAPAGAAEFGIKLLCSPDGEEETTVTYHAGTGEFVIDFARASTDTSLRYPHNVTRQVVPYSAADGALDLDIFVDRSVIEIFVGPRPGDGAARLSSARRQPAVQDLHPWTPRWPSRTSSSGRWTPPTPGDPGVTPGAATDRPFRRSCGR